jgi:hypothetical protein
MDNAFITAHQLFKDLLNLMLILKRELILK